MKNFFTLLLTTLILSSGIIAQNFTTSGLSPKDSKSYNGRSVTSSIYLTHSLSQTITSGSVSCNAAGLHADNSYIRVFDLANDFSITNGIEIASIDFGIELSTGATGNQPAIVNIYTLSGALEFANLTLISSESISIPDQSLSIFNAPIAASIPASSVLVVEIFLPDGQTNGNSFFIGSNPDGQTDPSYIAAADCGINEITDIAAVGFPLNQYVINVNAEPVTPSVPLKSWPIILSILLIGSFIFFRMK